jgi:hypothetical protein
MLQRKPKNHAQWLFSLLLYRKRRSSFRIRTANISLLASEVGVFGWKVATYCDKTSGEIERRDVCDYFYRETVIDGTLLESLQLFGHITELLRHISKLGVNLCSLQLVM